ncbi:dihydrofolate reductase [bacterium CPR1]|nr:MAG: dihydrofolate reductase [bacterium]MCE7875522.1 dihydrofolate reductase [bacterium CPR1]
MLAMIVAMGRNRVIGREGTLPWHLPADLKWFRQKTRGHSVIMGRRTWDSVGKPLPGRRSIILSRSMAQAPTGAELARSLEQALELCGDDPEPFIVGGGEVYRLALPRAGRIYLTLVDLEPMGNATFPSLGPEWVLTWRERHPADDRHCAAFEFQTLERQTP